MIKNKVCVIGLWHLGSVYSACLADLGYQVVGVDKDAKRVADLNRGAPPIFEPGLNELITKNVQAKRLSYTADLALGAKGSAYVLITFDTPVDDNDEVDLSQLVATCYDLGKCLEKGAVVIICSQVPIRTCERLKAIVKEVNPALDLDVAYTPENLRLGEAIASFKNPARLVIGADNPATLDKVVSFFNVIDAPKIRMNLRTAEMTKHALNAFLATCISFSGEIANLCDELGADAAQVMDAVRSDQRIGSRLPLTPGLGFAGGTLARDLKVLKNLGKDLRHETCLVDSVLTINQRQNKLVVAKLEKIYGSVKDLKVGILGLTYKAGTSTLRRSSALEIVKVLKSKGARVNASDPKAAIQEIPQDGQFVFYSDPYTAVKGTDAVIVLTDWPEFKTLDFDRIKASMKKPVLIDGKNMLDGEELTRKGFQYYGIGRGR